jgi:hypothetical protein
MTVVGELLESPRSDAEVLGRLVKNQQAALWDLHDPQPAGIGSAARFLIFPPALRAVAIHADSGSSTP